ncbi:mono/diheme cytochrome c family protein [Rhodoblastus sphagnicola]|nr:di-heme-cytochrome C peroxidase [Rhodoblastus sphagnicola]MBB4198114.1 mono/diheme cytochrome c family protein [Rhodoblastus sphagnicola]
MSIKKILLGSGAAVALVAASAVAAIEFPDEAVTLISGVAPNWLTPLLPPPLPKAKPVKAAYWLDQNWRLDDRRWFHHAGQGTATFPIPYAWFVALEQPYLSLFRQPGLLRDPDYLQRFGFIPSPKTDASATDLRAAGFGWSSAPQPPEIKPSTSLAWEPAPNDDALPVGFARLAGAKDPISGAAQPDGVGLTCAACHTGHVEYQGVTLRIDGAGAVIDLDKLQSILVQSLLYARYAPGRFDRFATRVLGEGAGDADKTALKQKLEATIADIVAVAMKTGQITHDAGQKATGDGPGRLDALNRIGNQVFFTDLSRPNHPAPNGNFHATDAPVSFPHIWTAPWFLWAQYDSSIEHPLIRNVGEAMGVAAQLNLTGADGLYRSTVKVANVLWVEDLLRGPDPFGAAERPSFGGLAAPQWPQSLFPDDAAWKIDPQKVSRGRRLYAELCSGCHLGPIGDAEFDQAYPDKRFWTSKNWIPVRGGAEQILAPPQIPYQTVGTDEGRALVLKTREVDTPRPLDIAPQRDISERWSCGVDLSGAVSPSGRMPFSLALMATVDNVIRKWMDDNQIAPAVRAAAFGPLKNCPNTGADQPYYRTRPLNGIWATAPYLHNGSVPSLYWLLRPAAERPRKFCIGGGDFDPKTVGFATPEGGSKACTVGETLFEAVDRGGQPIAGNGIGGHSFENGEAKPGAGVIGRALTDAERFDLIEYLKTL